MDLSQQVLTLAFSDDIKCPLFICDSITLMCVYSSFYNIMLFITHLPLNNERKMELDIFQLIRSINIKNIWVTTILSEVKFMWN